MAQETRFIVFIVSGLYLVPLIFGSEAARAQNTPPLDAQKRSELMGKIQHGDNAAILTMGKSGDSSVIPFLVSISSKPAGKSFGSRGGNIQMALAKLGSNEQFDEIVGELKDPRPGVQDEAVAKLQYVGGKQSISVLIELLDQDASRRYPVPPGMVAANDVFAFPLRGVAVRALSDMVPDAPTKHRLAPTASEKEVQLWKSWWKQNQDKYK